MRTKSGRQGKGLLKEEEKALNKEKQADGRNDREYSDSCLPGMETTKIDECEGSRP